MGFFSRRAPMSGPPGFIIVGLGNPGKQYELTRHNAGFLFADLLADKNGVKINKIQFKAVTASLTLGGVKCLLMKPQTFMNNSGEAIGEAARFFKVPPENVIVISDDISLPPGTIRIRRKGSAGGHNGLKSIIAHLGSDNFPRVKVGVGERKNLDSDLADHVLGTFSKEDAKVMNEAILNAVDAVELIVSGKTDEAMNRYN